ncbi:MAG: AmmeMemoRadiSam system radical SAM enzyme [Brevinematia bacterium]
MKEASFYQKLDNKAVRCNLCPHNCLISAGKSGICGARKNIDGILYTLNYGVVEGMAIDPIEKKPLYHYYPGSVILSVGTLGCNLKCPFCQNSHLSRFFDEFTVTEIEPNMSPEDLFLSLMKNQKLYNYNILPGIAYTYSEPIVWYEFVFETAERLKKNGYKNVLVTNGYIEKEPLKKILSLIDAANVDLKAFSEENYRKLTGKLSPVLDFINTLIEAKKHVEITTLIVTEFNDNLTEIENLVKWVSSLDRNIPFHFSRYYPAYKYNRPPTDIEFLRKAKEIAKNFLNYVYLGNVMESQNTYCPKCRNLLIQRNGYDINIVGISEKKCNKCGRKADFIFGD